MEGTELDLIKGGNGTFSLAPNFPFNLDFCKIKWPNYHHDLSFSIAFPSKKMQEPQDSSPELAPAPRPRMHSPSCPFPRRRKASEAKGEAGPAAGAQVCWFTRLTWPSFALSPGSQQGSCHSGTMHPQYQPGLCLSPDRSSAQALRVGTAGVIDRIFFPVFCFWCYSPQAFVLGL